MSLMQTQKALIRKMIRNEIGKVDFKNVARAVLKETSRIETKDIARMILENEEFAKGVKSMVKKTMPEPKTATKK